MAKVKTAVQKITEYLKAKGLDAGEIKDAFAELDAADADLDKVAALTKTAEDWNTWYQTVAPEISATISERDSLKTKLDALAKAGVKFDETINAGTGQVTTPAAQTGSVTEETLKKFQSDIANAASGTMKSLLKIGFNHYKKFGSEPDLDEIEKLMNESAKAGRPIDVDTAYKQWSKPMRDEAKAKKIQKQIDEGIKKGVQDAISKRGVAGVSRQKIGDLEVETWTEASKAPKDKGPSEDELRADFMNTLNSEVTH